MAILLTIRFNGHWTRTLVSLQAFDRSFGLVNHVKCCMDFQQPGAAELNVGFIVADKLADSAIAHAKSKNSKSGTEVCPRTRLSLPCTLRYVVIYLCMVIDFPGGGLSVVIASTRRFYIIVHPEA